jgi:hypothetical protein
MKQQSMRKAASAIGGVRHRERKERSGCREPFRSPFKIIMLSEVLRETIAQRISTGPSGDCETPVFANDSDVWATRAVPDPAVPSVVRSRRRGADLETGLEVY